MPAFRYQGLDAAGKLARGVIESDSPRQARNALRERGLLPTEVEPLVERGRARPAALGRLQLALLTRQLATLLGAGVSVEHALAALAEQSQSAIEREALASVRSEVLAGHALADAFTRAGFPALYCALVAAGERSGRLEAVVGRLADYLEQRQDARARITQALIYPGVVAVVAASVMAALLGYVVPQLVAVFESTGQALPWPTRVLLGVSGFVQTTWWLWLLVAGGGASLALWALSRQGPRERIQALLLRLPLIGPLLALADSARFAASLAILAGSGVPILAALESAAATVANLPLRRALAEAAGAVTEGVALSQALRATARFPPLLVHLVANGEATGELAKALDSAARAFDAELSARTQVVMALIEPALIVALGLFVLAVVLAVLLPVIEINQLLGAR